MFYYKMKDGRIVNLDNVVLITPLIANDGVQLTMTDGTRVNVLGTEWHDLEQLIESYTYQRLLKEN